MQAPIWTLLKISFETKIEISFSFFLNYAIEKNLGFIIYENSINLLSLFFLLLDICNIVTGVGHSF